ncbi:MAG: acetyltransferase [Acidobacteria bacterium]|nr:acetyltransferase [Acidobacteriota bacterium]
MATSRRKQRGYSKFAAVRGILNTQLVPSAESSSDGRRSQHPRRARVVVIGASGHARVVIDILRCQNRHEVVGLLDSFKPLETRCAGCAVLGTVQDLEGLVRHSRVDAGVVAIGDNWTRGRIVAELRAAVPEFPFVNAIHPSAQIARDAVLGPGTVVMAGAVVNPGCRVGEFCIVNTRASLDHDCEMDDYSSLGPGAVTGGCVQIGAYSAVAIGCVVVEEIRIGKHTVVGAGATVLGDLPEHVLAYGTPARTVRARGAGDPYLGELSRRK